MILSESSIRSIMRLLIKNQLIEVDAGLGLQLGSLRIPEEPQDHEVDMTGLTSKTKGVIDRIFSYADSINLKPTPVVTSAFRGPEKQAEVMFTNWKAESEGDVSKGTKYLGELYSDTALAIRIGKTFEKTADIKDAIAILKTSPISAHNNGEAFDLRSKGHPEIKAVLDIMVVEFAAKNITIEIGDETNKKGPHWHIRVK